MKSVRHHEAYCPKTGWDVTLKIEISQHPSGEKEIISMVGCSKERDCDISTETKSGSYTLNWDLCPIFNGIQGQ